MRHRVLFVCIYLVAALAISYGITYSREEFAKRPPWETPIVEPAKPESPELPPVGDDTAKEIVVQEPVSPPALPDIGNQKTSEIPVKEPAPVPDLPNVGDDPPNGAPVSGVRATYEGGATVTGPVAPPQLPDVGDDAPKIVEAPGGKVIQPPELPDVGDDNRAREIIAKEPLPPPALPDVGDDTTKEITVQEPVAIPSLPDVGDDKTREIPTRQAVPPPDLPSIGDDKTSEIPTREMVSPPALPSIGDDTTKEITVQEPVAIPSLPDVGDDTAKEIPLREAVKAPALPDVGDDTTAEIQVKEVIPPPPLPDVVDDETKEIPPITDPIPSPTLPSVGDDVTREITVKETIAPPPLPNVGDDTTKEILTREAVAPPSLPSVGDDKTREITAKKPIAAPSLPSIGNDKTHEITVVEPVKPPSLPNVGDEKTKEIKVKKALPPPNLPDVANERTQEISVIPPIAPPKLPDIKDEPVSKFITEFDGKWLPSLDPLVIGAKNFKTLTNMRYTERGIEGIQAYTKVNTTELRHSSDTLDIDAGYHLSTIYTQDTYALVHGTGGTPAYGYVYENLTDIGSQGSFGDLLYTDTHAALGNQSSFSAAPQRSVAYSNGKECCIWAGDEMRAAAFFALQKVESGTLTTLTWTAAGDTVAVGGAGYDWAANGFAPGQKVHVTGTTSNNRTLTIKAISSSTLTFVEDLVADEGSGTGAFEANVGSGGVLSYIDYSDAIGTQLTDQGCVAEVGAGGLDSDVVLLLHMDGDSGDIDFTDESDTGHTVTNPVASKVTVNTATKKFGTGSAYFDGNYLAITDDDGVSDHWDMGTSYTVDFWINPHSIPVSHATLFQQYDSTPDPDEFVLCRLHSDGTIRFYIEDGVNTSEMATSMTVGLAEWTHIAIIRGWDGNTNKWAITINGVEAALEDNTEMVDWPELDANLEIGGSSINASDFKGFIDEFRFTKDVARWTDDFTPPSRPYTDEAFNDFMVMSTRPLQGVKLYVQNPNTTASTLTGYVWAGNSFDELTITDGTDTGASLAQTGVVSFGDTTTTAKPLNFEGLYLYSYLFSLSAGSAAIYHVTVDAPFQKIGDIWDGVYRQPIAFQVSQDADGPYADYTADVYETSYPDLPIGAFVGMLPASSSGGHIIAMFDERQIALNFKMLSGLGNTNAAAPTVYRWDGTQWVDVELLKDSTVSNLTEWKSLESTGSYHWADRGEALENKVSLFGVTGYAYKIEFDAALSGTAIGNVVIDTVTGIPASNPPKGFAVTTPFGNRLLLINQFDANEGDRIDYCLPNAPDVWNGDLTSMDGYQSIYAGTGEPITAARQLFNRFGSNIFSTVVLTSDSTTHLLWGDSPEDFRIYPISFTVGCPAPKTMAVAEAGFEIANDVRRNTAFWISHAGPVMFDGVVIASIPGLEAYFDRHDTLYLGASNIAAANGWWDSSRKEYSFVAGSHWFTYSIDRKAWFYTDPPAYPNCAFPAVGDYGNQYIYAGFDGGYMRILDNGTAWDASTAITQTVETGDFYPLQDPWEMSSIESIKVVTKILTENVNLTVDVYSDTEGTTKAETWAYSIYAASPTDRLRRHNRKVNIPGWSARLKFSTYTTTTSKGFQPVLWGYLARSEYEDSVPSN